MSWEHDTYTITCKKCGHTGRLIISSDDWNRMEATWESFAEIRTSSFNPTASWGRCLKCGNDERSEIEITRAGSN
jgi:predicted nucleic-acid-binding Zn-ribbon protein